MNYERPIIKRRTMNDHIISRPIDVVNRRPRSMRPQKPATAAPARLIARSVDTALLDRHWPNWRAETEPNILVAWLRAWHAEEENQ